jgi:hypothetical protein
MGNIANIGRIFYGIAMAALGFLTMYYHDFPYMLIPAKHQWIPGLELVCYIFGALLLLAGACIALEKKTRLVSLLLGGFLLLIFCFYFIPYQLSVSARYLHYGTWENAAKVLALSGGAFVIAGVFSGKNDQFAGKLTAFGSILYAITIISFGIDHFVYGKQAAGYVPSWIPNHIFWIYFAGIPLLGSGIAILLKIKVPLIAFLLGSMIFIWFIILHIPYVVAASFSDKGGEVTSAFLALAYSGSAFVIAGRSLARYRAAV